MGRIAKLFKRAATEFLSLLPVEKDLVLLEGNKAYDDNTRALFEYMYGNLGLGKTYRFIWFVDNPADYPYLEKLHNVEVRGFPEQGAGRLRHPFELLEFLRLNFVARYCIYANVFLGKRRRAGQERLYLMHGVALKNTVGLFGSSECHAFAFATSERSAEWVRKAIPGMEERVLITGYPRNDFLLRGSDGRLCERFLSGSSFMRKILWMPTFKHLGSTDRNDISKDRDRDLQLLDSDFMQRLNSRLAELNACLFVKFHPFQNLDFVDFYSLSNIVCLTKSDLEKERVCLYSLVSEFDALITDYSSIAFDYMLLDRPIGYDLTDYEAYRDGVGFIVDDPLDYMPGFKIRSQDDFLGFVSSVVNGEDAWVESRREACRMMNAYQDDRSSERVFSHLGIGS